MTNPIRGRRKKKEKDFVQIQNSMFEDTRISWKAKGLLGYLLSRPEEGWDVFIADIVKRSTDGESAVKSAIKELKEAGYLIINKVKNEKGQFIGAEWIYDDVPFNFPPKVENPPVGKTDLRKNALYNNTKKNNIKENNTKLKDIVNKENKSNKNNDQVNTKQEIIDKLILEYMKKGLNKKVSYMVIEQIMPKGEIPEGITNLGGYIRNALENTLRRSQVKHGIKDPAEKLKANSNISFYNWLES